MTVKILFWWQRDLCSLFPAIGQFLHRGTDRYKIVKLLRLAGFNVEEWHIQKFMEEIHGNKRGYVENVLIDHYKAKKWEAFEKLADLLRMPDYFRKDYNYEYTKRSARRLANAIRRAVKVEKRLASKGLKAPDLFGENLKRTAAVTVGCATVVGTVFTVLQYFRL